MVSQLLQRPLLLESSLTQYRISLQRCTNASTMPLVAELTTVALLLRHDTKMKSSRDGRGERVSGRWQLCMESSGQYRTGWAASKSTRTKRGPRRVRRPKLRRPPTRRRRDSTITLVRHAAAPAAARAPRPAKRPTRRPCDGARSCQVVHFQYPTAPDASPTPRRAADVS